MALFEICLLVSFCSLIGVRLHKNWALRVGWVDKPDSVRKQQRAPIPTSAGAPGALCFLMGACLFYFFDASEVRDSFESVRQVVAFSSLLVATSILVLVGFVDDRRELSGKVKLFCQFAVAVAFLGVSLKYKTIDFSAYSTFVSCVCVCAVIFWILGAINSFNLLDGADGFLATFALCCTSTLALVARLRGLDFCEAMCWILVVSLCGFSFYNRPSAKVYMGDAGSLSLGFVVGVLSLSVFLVDNQTFINDDGAMQIKYMFRPMSAICLLTLPIADSFFAIMRRHVLGRSLFAPDLAHLHHRLQRRFGKGFPTLGALVVIQAPLCLFSYAGVYYRSEWIPTLGIALVLSALFFTKIFGYEETTMTVVRAYAKLTRLFGWSSRKVLFVAVQNDGRWRDFWKILSSRAQTYGCGYCSLAMNFPSAGISWFGELQNPQNPQNPQNLISLSSSYYGLALPLTVDRNVVGLLKIRFDIRRTSFREVVEAALTLHELCAQTLAFFGSCVELYSYDESRTSLRGVSVSSRQVMDKMNEETRELFEDVSNNALIE